MVRALVLALCIAACATTSEQERLTEACRRDLDHDPRCLELVTSDGQEYESKAQVMEAEAQREARAFDDRLARLRREEEERQAARARTSTPAQELEAEEPLTEEAKDLAGAKIEGPGALEVGSSVRALSPLTPEDYFRGARCLLAEDLAALRKEFEEGKRARLHVAAAKIGEMAVVILDAERLMGRIDEEMKHRRLPPQGPECKQQGQVIELLRSLVGKRIDTRGLARLTKELELRAGLPRAE